MTLVDCVNKRVLYHRHNENEWFAVEGYVAEVSPSKKYAKIGGEWLYIKHYDVVEVLGE